jgi:hypothetical protein
MSLLMGDCPFCGSEYMGERGIYDDFRCGTYYKSATILMNRSRLCERYQRAKSRG